MSWGRHAGALREKPPREIRGTGHVVRTLEAALWAFATTDDVRRGALTVVNLGDDADTTGRCTGKSLAPLYGAQAIPDAWASRLATRDEIEALLGHLVTQCIDAAS